MRRLARALFALACAGTAAVAVAAVSVVDDDGRVVTLAAPAADCEPRAARDRISCSRSDAGARVSAPARPSDWPPEARSLPRVGDARAIDLERIVALAPDLVVTWPYTAPAQVARLRARGVPVFVLDARSLDVLPSQIARLGRLLGDAGRAETLAAARAAQLEALRALPRRAARRRVLRGLAHAALHHRWRAPHPQAIALCGETNVRRRDGAGAAGQRRGSSGGTAAGDHRRGDGGGRPAWLDEWRR
ncbi:MAG: ABC transporter substrate-binding protein [Betaproteobacteria bacterium]|nr:ABC transporter substrate-binding protein [Betaproteobacteria bacterium]